MSFLHDLLTLCSKDLASSFRVEKEVRLTFGDYTFDKIQV